MQYHSCVCIIEHAEPQNWFNPGVGGGCIPLYLVKVPFWDSNYIFWHFILTFLFKNGKLRIKEKEKKSRPLFSDILDGSEKGKQTPFFFFFLGLIWICKNIKNGIGVKTPLGKWLIDVRYCLYKCIQWFIFKSSDINALNRIVLCKKTCFWKCFLSKACEKKVIYDACCRNWSGVCSGFTWSSWNLWISGTFLWQFARCQNWLRAIVLLPSH